MPQFWQPTHRRKILLAAARVVSRAVDILRPGSRPAARNVEVQSILVIELWNIGDVILAMPFLAQLRAVFPGAKVTLLSRAFARELLQGTGLVDEFVIADLTWRAKNPGLDPVAPDWRELWSALRKLRRLRFDLGFSARLHLREHLILQLGRARRRVGYAFAAQAGFLTDAIPVIDADQHKVADWLALLEPFGGPLPAETPGLSVSPAEVAWARDYLASNGVSESDLLVGVHPGASLSQKRWPIGRFGEVADAVRKTRGIRTLIFIEPGGYGSDLSAHADVLTRELELRELVALIERCDLLVCNDSGPMHIAGALGVPVVAVFLAGINRWFAPLGDQHEFVSGDSPSSGEAGYSTARIDEIPASRVAEATMRLLRATRVS